MIINICSIIISLLLCIQTVCLVNLEINRRRNEQKEKELIDLQIKYHTKVIERLLPR